MFRRQSTRWCCRTARAECRLRLTLGSCAGWAVARLRDAPTSAEQDGEAGDIVRCCCHSDTARYMGHSWAGGYRGDLIPCDLIPIPAPALCACKRINAVADANSHLCTRGPRQPAWQKESSQMTERPPNHRPHRPLSPGGYSSVSANDDEEHQEEEQDALVVKRHEQNNQLAPHHHQLLVPPHHHHHPMQLQVHTQDVDSVPHKHDAQESPGYTTMVTTTTTQTVTTTTTQQMRSQARKFPHAASEANLLAGRYAHHLGEASQKPWASPERRRALPSPERLRALPPPEASPVTRIRPKAYSATVEPARGGF